MDPCVQQLSRAKSGSDSSKSKEKEKDRNASPSPSSTAPGHPLRNSTTTGTGPTSLSAASSTSSLSSTTGSGSGLRAAGTPDRRPGHGAGEKTSPAPPLVVVSGAPSSDGQGDGVPHGEGGYQPGSPTNSTNNGNLHSNGAQGGIPNPLLGNPLGSPSNRTLGSGGVGGLTVGMAGIGLEGRQPGQPPKAGQLTKLRQGPRDTIPIVGKSPRKQRSSRFHVTEKVHLEKLPAFNG